MIATLLHDPLMDDCPEILDRIEYELEFIPFEDKKLEADWKTNGVTRILFSVEGAQTITLTIEKTEEEFRKEETV
jgi:hypothetical protein